MAGLKDRLNRDTAQMAAEGLLQASSFRQSPEARALQEMKTRIHQRLLERMDLTVMETLPMDELRRQLKDMVERLIDEEAAPLNETERPRWCATSSTRCSALGP